MLAANSEDDYGLATWLASASMFMIHDWLRHYSYLVILFPKIINTIDFKKLLNYSLKL